MTDEEIEALNDPHRWAMVFDDTDRLVLAFADAMCGPDTSTLDASLVAGLQAVFSEAQLAELILVAGQANLNNRAGNAAKQLLGPDERRT